MKQRSFLRRDWEKVPGNVSDGVRAGYGGQHVLLAGLQHRHAHDDGARVQDLKSQNEGGTGNYISCRKLGYNTSKGDIFRTTGQRSVKRLIEKYEMLEGVGSGD